MTAEIDIVDERSHVRFGKKWVEQLFKQRLGDDRPLNEIVQKMMRDAIGGHAEFNDLTEEQKEKVSFLAFCGKLEFKYLQYDRI
ncbi:MAG TPA: hypothetical protein VGE40_10635 [Bacilli bacterium]